MAQIMKNISVYVNFNFYLEVYQSITIQQKVQTFQLSKLILLK